MPTTLAFAPCPEDLADIFFEAPLLCQSPVMAAPQDIPPSPDAKDPPQDGTTGTGG